MARRTLILIASLAAVIASVGFVATNRTLAAEPHIAGMQVTSGDATSRFMALGVSKSVVIDFSTDIKDVLITDKGVVNAVLPAKRRAYIIGQALGQTSVYFFDANGRQIGALDIAVTSHALFHALENYPFPANVVLVFNGTKAVALSCTPIMCVDGGKPGADEVPGTQNINVTGNVSAVAVSAGK
jgi:hypothetical protein